MSVLSQFFGGGGVDIEVLAVGGGGAGASVPGASGGGRGGGGGAGQLVYQKLKVSRGISYTIEIGAGGASPGGFNASLGSDTGFGGNIVIAYGGGNGGNMYNPPSPAAPALAQDRYEGSAGGGGGINPLPPTGSYDGGDVLINFTGSNTGYKLSNSGGSGGPVTGGGGGGAGNVGSNGPGGTGGIGMILYQIGYPSIEVCGGGGGAPSFSFPTYGGGLGGPKPAPQLNATANTGGGGGGAAPAAPTGGSGGSGVLFIRYPTSYDAATVTGNTATPAQSGYHVYRWNSGPGTITFN